MSSILELLRDRERMTVADFALELRVTATAVRQKLQRLLAEQLIERSPSRGSRGRPKHEYSLTEKGRRTAGTNFSDLAVALWTELRAISAPEVRRGLMQRIAERMSAAYRSQIDAGSTRDRMVAVADLFTQRKIPLRVEEDGRLPVLKAVACPYPELAEQDRSICSMERLLFSELVGERLKLSECRLDGDSCCTFSLPSGEAASCAELDAATGLDRTD